ncbi:MAG: EscU/YscU/HrcU family type III secretion system export apparatus switch protein, partial [Desulfobacterales bacterium]
MSSEDSPRKKAIALRYDREKHDAPVIAASGRGEVAERIL